jgi:hypothetical protein
MLYSMRNYNKLSLTGWDNVSFAWKIGGPLNGSSYNLVPYFGGISIDREAFDHPRRAIGELIHEPLHDWYGPGHQWFWPFGGPSDPHIKDIVGPTGQPISPFGSDFDQLIDFLEAAKGWVTGESLWQQIREKAGPAPVKPQEPQYP